MSSMMFDDCFRVFNLFSLFSLPLWAATARASKNTEKLMKERKTPMLGSDGTPRLTHTISFPPSRRIVQSLWFVLLFLFLHHTINANERDENIIRWFYVGFTSIEMPSMVSVFWWLLAGQVDEITVLFVRVSGLTSFCGELRPSTQHRTFLFAPNVRYLSWNWEKRKIRRNIFGRFWKRLKKKC